MPLVRVEVPAESREESRRVAALYRDGRHARALEQRVLDELLGRGLTPRGRPRLAGMTAANPPVLFFDTQVHADTT